MGLLRDGAPAHITGTLKMGDVDCSVIPTMYTRDIIYSGKWANDMRNSEIVFRRRFKGNVPISLLFKAYSMGYYLLWQHRSSHKHEYASLCYPVFKISTTNTPA